MSIGRGTALINIAIKPNREKIPYAKPQPFAIRPDLLKPMALDLDADPSLCVSQAEGVDFKPLLLSVSQGFYDNLLHLRHSGLLSRHRHTGPVHAFSYAEDGTTCSMTEMRRRQLCFRTAMRNAHACCPGRCRRNDCPILRHRRLCLCRSARRGGRI